MAELISEYQDDQQPAGGLAQVTSDRSVNSAPAPAAAPASPQPSEYEKAMIVLQKQKQELLANQQRLVDSLEARVAGPQEMLWGLARAFSAPTKTGSFGESFGHATEALGQHFAQQKQQISEVAKMRHELGAQNVAMQEKEVERLKEERAFDLIGQTVGGNNQSVEQALGGGPLSPENFQRLLKVYPKIEQLSPKAGKALKNSFDMTMEISKRAEEARKLSLNEAEYASKVAQLRAQFGDEVLAWLPKVPSEGISGAAPSGVSGQPQPTGPLKERVPTPAQPQGAQAGEPKLARLPGESLSTYQDRLKQHENNLNDIYKEKSQYFVSLDYNSLKSSQSQLEELHNFIKQDEQRVQKAYAEYSKTMNPNDAWRKANVDQSIFGLFKDGTFVSSLNAAAKEALRLGNTTVSLPTEVIATRLRRPELQSQAIRISQIMADQFLQNARANKGVLGAQVSNFDAQSFQKPMAQETDPRSAVEYWTKLNILANKERQDVAEKFGEYVRAKKNPYEFAISKDYKDISDKYYSLRQQFDKIYRVPIFSSESLPSPEKKGFFRERILGR